MAADTRAVATLESLVAHEVASLRTRRLTVTLAMAVGAALLLLSACAMLLGNGRWWMLPRGVPVLGMLIAIAAAGVVALRVWQRAAPWVASDRVLPDLESSNGMRDGALRAALEVGGGSALGRRAAERLVAQLTPSGAGAPRTLAAVATRARSGEVARVAAILAAVGAVAIGLVRGVARDGLSAALHPMAAWAGTVGGALEIEPLPARVPEGAPLSVTVRAIGRPAVTLHWRSADGAWDSTRVTVAADGRASVAIPVVAPTLRLFATDGRGVSDSVQLQVGAAAGVRDVTLEARFPTASGRTPENIALGTPVPLPRGSSIRIGARVIGALDRVALTTGSDTLWLAPAADGRVQGVLPVLRSGEWRWVVDGRDEALVELPANLVLDVGMDAAPVARILSPSSDTVVTPGDVVPLQFAASDDHALSQVSVVVRREGDRSGSRTTRTVVADAVGPEWTGAWSLPLDRLGLGAGESVTLTLVAVDDAPDRQRAESAPVRLRVPQVSEQRELSRTTGEALARQAQSLASAQRQLERKTQEAARAARAGGDKAMSYDAAEKAKALAQAQRQTTEQVRKMADEARRLEQQLKGASALDSSLAQQLRDAQALMREAMSPELQQQLASLEKSAQSLDNRQARQSMEQLAEQQRAMREQLERSAEMLKRAALEGALATLRDEAKDVAKAQRDMAQRAQGDTSNASPSGAPSAEQLADRAQKVAKESRALADRLDQAGAKAGAAKARAADPKALASAEKMRQVAQREQQPARDAKTSAPSPSAQSPRGGQQPAPGNAPQQKSPSTAPGTRSAEDTKAAAESMEQAAQQLAEAREAQVGQWKNEVGQQLDQAIQELNQLQRAQQQLEQQMKEGADAQQMQAQQNAVQQGVDKVAQRMQQAGKASSLVSQRTQKAMADAQKQMQRAKDAMNGQQGTESQPGQQGQQGQPGQQGQQAQGGQQGQSGKSGARDAAADAANALSDAAASMVRDRERLNGASSASGFSDMVEQMKDLAQQQSALNGQLSQMGLNPGGGKQEGVGIGKEDREKVAQQQRQIARALEDVADADATGKADALAREAKALASALEGGAPDPAVLQRQQQLYKRMLSAGQFLEQEEQDESGKREATPFRGGAPFVPAAAKVTAKPLEPYAAPGWDALRGLSAEERRLVGEYFKRLNAKP